jgi:PTS system, fructose subfamily, IIA component
MNIADVIKKEYIVLRLEARQRDEALKELLEIGSIQVNITDRDAVFQELLAREASFTTKVMDLIAIPHAKSDGVKEAMVLIGKSKEGISWGQGTDLDSVNPEERVELIFMILVPGQSESNEHLKILAMLARCLTNEQFRENLLCEEDAAKVHKLVVDEITARMGKQ